MPAPVNDLFANAQTIASIAEQTVSGTTVDASNEAGETWTVTWFASQYPAFHTVWYTVVAPFTGYLRIGFSYVTAFPGFWYYPTYQLFDDSGTDATNPGAKIPSGGGTQGYPILTQVTGGNTYRLAVASGDDTNPYGYNPTGTFTLDLSFRTPMANDNFASPTVLSSVDTQTVTGWMDGATLEAGEIWTVYGSDAVHTSVWYTIVAPLTGFLKLDIGHDGQAATGLAVFDDTGTSAASPGVVLIDQPGMIPVVSGSTYRIGVANYNGGVNGGNFTMSLLFGVAPVNDDFANATELTGASGQLTGQNSLFASLEPSEPIPYRSAQTLWYKITATADELLQVDTLGSSGNFSYGMDSVIDVWTGSEVAALTQVAFNDDHRLSLVDPGGFRYTSAARWLGKTGVTYHVRVYGYGGEENDHIIVNWYHINLDDTNTIFSEVDFGTSVAFLESTGDIVETEGGGLRLGGFSTTGVRDQATQFDYWLSDNRQIGRITTQRVVIGGQTTASGTVIAYSDDDGLSFTAATTPFDGGGVYEVTFGAGLFMAIGNDSTNHYRVMSSPDGVVWTAITTPIDGTGFLSGVAYGMGAWIAWGTDTTNDAWTYIRSIDNGVTWAAHSTVFNDASFTALTGQVKYGNGEGTFVASITGNHNAHATGAMHSWDAGATWNLPASGPTAFVWSLNYGDSQSFAGNNFIATDGNNNLWYSRDGNDWTLKTFAAGVHLYGASWNGIQASWTLFAHSDTNQRLVYAASYPGNAWASEVVTNIHFLSYAESAATDAFIVGLTCDDGFPGSASVARSLDGIGWVPVNTPLDEPAAVNNRGALAICTGAHRLDLPIRLAEPDWYDSNLEPVNYWGSIDWLAVYGDHLWAVGDYYDGNTNALLGNIVGFNSATGLIDHLYIGAETTNLAYCGITTSGVLYYMSWITPHTTIHRWDLVNGVALSDVTFSTSLPDYVAYFALSPQGHIATIMRASGQYIFQVFSPSGQLISTKMFTQGRPDGYVEGMTFDSTGAYVYVMMFSYHDTTGSGIDLFRFLTTSTSASIDWVNDRLWYDFEGDEPQAIWTAFAGPRRISISPVHGERFRRGSVAATLAPPPLPPAPPPVATSPLTTPAQWSFFNTETGEIGEFVP